VLGSEQSPSRWIPSRGKDTRYSINVFLPEKHEINVSIEGNTYQVDIDGVETPFCGIPFKTFFFNKKVLWVCEKNSLKESEYLCKVLNVDVHTLMKLFKKIGLSDYSKINKVVLNESVDEINDVDCTLKNRDFSVSLNTLSGGESNSLIFELLIAKMQSYAEFTPLILFIESAQTSFDNSLISHYLDFLNSSEIGFQTIVTSLSSTVSKPSIGVAHFVLHGANSNVEVSQA
jgi:hypothetical protein